jgi:hypothetical protein
MSESVTAPVFECPQCGKKGKWSPNLAGKKVKCKCGATFIAPASLEALSGEPVETAPQKSAPKPPTKPVAKQPQPQKEKPAATDTAPAKGSASKVQPSPKYMNTTAVEDSNKSVSQGGSENASKITGGAKHITVKRTTPKAKSDDDLYELAPAHEPPKNMKPPTIAPAGEGTPGAGAESPVPGMGTAVKPRKKYEEEPPTEKLKYSTFPKTFLITSLLLSMVYGWLMKTSETATFTNAFKDFALRFGLGAAVMVAGYFLLTSVLKVDFGAKGLALFKLVSISAAPLMAFGFVALILSALNIKLFLLGAADMGWLWVGLEAFFSLLMFLCFIPFMLNLNFKKYFWVALVLWVLRVGIADVAFMFIQQRLGT